MFAASFAAVSAGGFVALYGFAAAGDCGQLPREDLSLREMADLRNLIDAYKVDDTPLALTARQASFLLREELKVPAWLEIVGATVRVEARLPNGPPERCWSVTYRGTFQVEGGHAYVVPDLVRIGRLDLGWWLAEQRMELPEVVVVAGGPKFTEFFSHVESLQVADGGLTLQLDDPRWMR